MNCHNPQQQRYSPSDMTGVLIVPLEVWHFKGEQTPWSLSSEQTNKSNVSLLKWIPFVHEVTVWHLEKIIRYSVQVGLSPVVVTIKYEQRWCLLNSFFFTCEPSSRGLKSPIICLSSRDVTECAPMASSIPIRDSTEPDENKETIWD